MRLLKLILRLLQFHVLVAAIELHKKNNVPYRQNPLIQSPIRFPRLEEVGIEEINTLLEDGALTSVNLVHASSTHLYSSTI